MSPIPSVDKALQVLQILATRDSWDLGSIAAATGMPLPSAHRTVRALAYRSFVEQSPESRKYRVGSEFLRLAFSYYDRMDVRQLVRPVLEDLSFRVGETVHLGTLAGHDVVYIDKMEPEVPIKLASTIGTRNPASCTALGKAILAFKYPSSEAVDEAFREGKITLVPKTQRSIRTLSELDEALKRIRVCGFAVDDQENELGVKCVAIPILVGGVPVAAVSVSGPTERVVETARIAAELRSSVIVHVGAEHVQAAATVGPG